MNVSLIGYLFSVYNPVYYTLSIDIYTHRDRYVMYMCIFSNCNNCGYRRRKEAAEKFSFGTILWYTSNVIFPIQFTKYIFFLDSRPPSNYSYFFVVHTITTKLLKKL